jgi:hypothetical protein
MVLPDMRRAKPSHYGKCGLSLSKRQRSVHAEQEPSRRWRVFQGMPEEIIG